VNSRVISPAVVGSVVLVYVKGRIEGVQREECWERQPTPKIYTTYIALQNYIILSIDCYYGIILYVFKYDDPW